MSVAVLVPFRPDGGWRDRVLAFVHARYNREHPTWPIILGACSGTDRSVGALNDWSKGEAVADARSRTSATVLVIADADSFMDARRLDDAVTTVQQTGRWVTPYETVRRLNEQATRHLLTAGGEPLGFDRQRDAARDEYHGYAAGGIVVLPAEVYDDCPLDPRFHGWGGEDESWGYALTTLHREPVVQAGHLWHLWHPHPLPGARFPVNPATISRLRAYQEANEVPRMMRALVRGEVAPPPVQLDKPVRFRSAFGTVRAAKRNVTFHRGELETTDPDVVEVLRSMPGVEAVTDERV